MAESTGGIRAGRAFVELLLSDKGLKGGLDKAGRKMQAWGASINAMGVKMMAAGAAIVAPLVAASRVFATMGDDLAKASTRTGVGVEALSALAYAADQSGSNLEGLENGLRHMSKTIVGAVQGSDEATDSLKALGLTVEDLKGLQPDEQFVTIAEALSKIVDPSAKAALAMKVFGKSGTSLIPLMADGAAGINELVKRAEELGLTWSPKDAKAAEEFGDRCDDLFHVLKRGVATIGGAVVPIFRQAAVVMTDVAVRASKWIREHESLVQTALKVGLGVAAAGVAFVVMGTAIRSIGGVVSGVASAMSMFGGAISGAIGILTTVLTSGVGLAIVALVGLGAYLLYNTRVGQSALSALAGYFTTLRDTATEALGGIVDALKAGDFAMAAQILWLGVKTAFAQGIQPLRDLWYGFRRMLVSVAIGAFDGVLAAWDIARNTLTTSWIKLTTTLSQIWTNFTSGITQGFEIIQDGLAKVLLELGVGGLDENQKQAAHKMLDDQSTANIRRMEAERTAAVDAAQKQANAELEAEQKRHAERMGKIGEHYNDTDAAARSQSAADAEADRKRTAELQEQLRAARGLAAAGAKNVKGFDAPGRPTPPSADDLAASLDGLSKKTFSTAGIFNANAIQSLQGGGQVDRIARATEETAKNTKRIVDRGPGTRFG